MLERNVKEIFHVNRICNRLFKEDRATTLICREPVSLSGFVCIPRLILFNIPRGFLFFDGMERVLQVITSLVCIFGL